MRFMNKDSFSFCKKRKNENKKTIISFIAELKCRTFDSAVPTQSSAEYYAGTVPIYSSPSTLLFFSSKGALFPESTDIRYLGNKKRPPFPRSRLGATVNHKLQSFMYETAQHHKLDQTSHKNTFAQECIQNGFLTTVWIQSRIISTLSMQLEILLYSPRTRPS